MSDRLCSIDMHRLVLLLYRPPASSVAATPTLAAASPHGAASASLTDEYFVCVGTTLGYCRCGSRTSMGPTHDARTLQTRGEDIDGPTHDVRTLQTRAEAVLRSSRLPCGCSTGWSWHHNTHVKMKTEEMSRESGAFCNLSLFFACNSTIPKSPLAST